MVFELSNPVLTKGEAWFNRFEGLPGPFGRFRPSEIDSARCNSFFAVTEVYAAFFLAELYNHLGDFARARAFAKAGLAIGTFDGVTPALRRALKASKPR
jgi:hypothetical protein